MLRSASRKAVLPEKENGMLYYATFCEGLEQPKNVIDTSHKATQQIIVGLDSPIRAFFTSATKFIKALS